MTSYIYAISSHSARPPINPDFNPDESCLFDVYQLKCIPGAEQECPRPQFGNNDDSTCFPMNGNGNVLRIIILENMTKQGNAIQIQKDVYGIAM